jgi:hypothetical protein
MKQLGSPVSAVTAGDRAFGEPYRKRGFARE